MHPRVGSIVVLVGPRASPCLANDRTASKGLALFVPVLAGKLPEEVPNFSSRASISCPKYDSYAANLLLLIHKGYDHKNIICGSLGRMAGKDTPALSFVRIRSVQRTIIFCLIL